MRLKIPHQCYFKIEKGVNVYSSVSSICIELSYILALF